MLAFARPEKYVLCYNNYKLIRAERNENKWQNYEVNVIDKYKEKMKTFTPLNDNKRNCKPLRLTKQKISVNELLPKLNSNKNEQIINKILLKGKK